jgi:DNA-binding PadR family transcriptional regulator
LDTLYIGCPIYAFKYIGYPILLVNDEEQSSCCPPDCCDMRGFLTFQILWELKDEPLYGQQIADRLGARRGSTPTAGTIYPALKELKERGLIEGKKQGREIIYTLTEAGQTGLRDAARYFNQAFGYIVEECQETGFCDDSC